MRFIIRQPACRCCEAWRSQIDAVQDHPEPKRVLELLTAAVACKNKDGTSKSPGHAGSGAMAPGGDDE